MHLPATFVEGYPKEIATCILLTNCDPCSRNSSLTASCLPRRITRNSYA